MKKHIITLCMLLALIMAWGDPIIEDFEDGIMPPDQWQEEGNSWICDPFGPYEGQYCAYILEGLTGRLISPLADISDADQLTFWAKKQGAEPVYLDIEYSSDGQEWTLIDSIEIIPIWEQYTLDLSAAAGAHYLSFFKTGYGHIRLDYITLPGPAADPGTVTGTVTSQTTSQPLPFAEIWCDTTLVAQCDVSGYYSAQLDAGDYSLQCICEHYSSTSQPISIVSGETTTADFALEPLPSLLWGMVTTDDGTPLANAEIHFDNEVVTQSDLDGSYSVEVCAGTFVLGCQKDGYEPSNQLVTIALDDTLEINFELTPQSGTHTNMPAPQQASICNYPNPFNPTTEIRFQISDARQLEQAQIAIFNVKGQMVKEIKADMSSRAQSEDLTFSTTWDGTDQSGNSLGSGIYFARLEINHTACAQTKLVLMK
jgi:hypothetical protein